MPSKVFFYLTRGLALSLLSAGTLLAEAGKVEIVVTDCQGAPRAVQNVSPGSARTLQIKVTGASGEFLDEREVSLFSPAGAESKAMTKNGNAMLGEVGAGQWKACPVGADARISQIALIDSSTDAEGNTLAVGTGIIGGTAAIAGLVLGSSSNSDSSDSADTSSDLLSVDSSSGASATNQAGTEVTTNPGRPTINEDAEDCVNEDEPDPISSFL